MNYSKEELALMKEKGINKIQDWAQYRITLKRKLAQKGTPYQQDTPTAELEKLAGRK